MHPFILMLVLSCVAAGVFGSAILARDPGQRANRLIAAVLGCSAYWSLCEILWNLSDDPDAVVWMIRLSSFGWIPLGPLALDPSSRSREGHALDTARSSRWPIRRRPAPSRSTSEHRGASRLRYASHGDGATPWAPSSRSPSSPPSSTSPSPWSRGPVCLRTRSRLERGTRCSGCSSESWCRPPSPR